MGVRKKVYSSLILFGLNGKIKIKKRKEKRRDPWINISVISIFIKIQALVLYINNHI